jgi:hypothetical protein
VETLAVVDGLDEAADLRGGFGEIAIGGGVDLLSALSP